MALGKDARMNTDGFKFDREKKEWTATFSDIIDYNHGVEEDDIDEEFIVALLLTEGREHPKPVGHFGG